MAISISHTPSLISLQVPILPVASCNDLLSNQHVTLSFLRVFPFHPPSCDKLGLRDVNIDNRVFPNGSQQPTTAVTSTVASSSILHEQLHAAQLSRFKSPSASSFEMEHLEGFVTASNQNYSSRLSSLDSASAFRRPLLYLLTWKRSAVS